MVAVPVGEATDDVVVGLTDEAADAEEEAALDEAAGAE